MEKTTQRSLSKSGRNWQFDKAVRFRPDKRLKTPGVGKYKEVAKNLDYVSRPMRKY